MKNILQMFSILSLILIPIYTSQTQSIPVDSLYLGQIPPGNTPKLFNLAVSSGFAASERIAISPDSKRIYYGEVDTILGATKINYFTYSSDTWNGPFILFDNYNSPAFSLSGDTLFYQNYQDNKPCSYYSVRNDTGWSSPSIFMRGIDMHYLQITNVGFYISTSTCINILGQGDISCIYISGSDTVSNSMGIPLNSSGNEGDFYISKDESFIIFASPDRGGLGLGDLFISYRKNDFTWTNPKNLGSPINTSGYEWGTYVTSDNKYLFYSSTTYKAVCWARIDNLIDSLKHTNFTPYAKCHVSPQTAVAGKLFSFTVPDSIFYDDDGNNTLTYSATLNTGYSLPSWLSFDTSTHTFSGTPLASRELPLYVKITAKDTAQANSSCQFVLYVIDPPSSVEGSNLLPNELRIEQNYPNPFNPTTTIRYSLAKSSFVKLTIYNTLGQKIRTLKDSYQSAGEHSVVWDAHDERNNPVSSGIYFYRIETNNQAIPKKMLLLK